MTVPFPMPVLTQGSDIDPATGLPRTRRNPEVTPPAGSPPAPGTTPPPAGGPTPGSPPPTQPPTPDFPRDPSPTTPNLPPPGSPPPGSPPPGTTPPPATPPPPFTAPPTPVGPGDPQWDANLRTRVFGPGNSPTTTTAQTNAAAAYGQTAPSPFVSNTAGAVASNADALRGPLSAGVREVQAGQGDGGSARTEQAINALMGGPSRTQLAQDAMRAFDAEQGYTADRSTRSILDRAAGAGRLGFGGTQQEIADLGAQLGRARATTAAGLARDVAEGDIGDRYRTFDAASGLEGQRFGQGLTNRNEARGEQGRQLDMNVRSRSSNMDALNALLGADQQQYGQFADTRNYGLTRANALDQFTRGREAFDAGQRDEFRTERGRQDTQQQQAITNSQQAYNQALEAWLNQQRLGLGYSALGNQRITANPFAGLFG